MKSDFKGAENERKMYRFLCQTFYKLTNKYPSFQLNAEAYLEKSFIRISFIQL